MRFAIKKRNIKAETKSYIAELFDDNGNIVKQAIASDYKALDMVAEYCRTASFKCLQLLRNGAYVLF